MSTKRRGHLWVGAAVLLAVAVPCRADWETNGSCKMHGPQLPDLTPMGMDVSATLSGGYALADDFRCTQSGPITNIHIWGSWLSDRIDTSAVFKLSIHADIPTNQSQLYSMPSNPALWQAVLVPAQYTQRVWTNNIAEGWFEPPSGYMPPPADTICFQYNFPIQLQQAFEQVSGTVYWLEVQATATNLFGWKTSTNHWNDDAVYSWQGGAWQELRYPNGHPLHPQSIDLSFVIEGQGAEPPEPRPECAKWVQPPDCDIGVDVESWTMQSGGAGTPQVADDWLCDGRPITAVRWWGSYIGWQTNNADPVPPPPASRPVGFLLTWFTDIPSNTYGYSQPGGIIATSFYPLAPFQSNWTGFVREDTQCVSTLGFLGPGIVEHEYSYYVALTNDWNEKEPRIYWLSVQAVYLAMPEHIWGWKTTPVAWNWNDDAVMNSGVAGWTNMTYPPPGWGYVTNHPDKGQSVDMSFELLTDVCPARCKKWDQPPDMIAGQDMQSWRIGTNAGSYLRADDFVSDGRPITDVHWWGSYLNWFHDWPFSETNPCPVPMPPNRPVGFLLSWHEEAAGGLSIPGPLITNYFISITNCHEMYYGSVTQSWLGGPPFLYEHEFQYYADFLDPDVGLPPWYETNLVHYWLNIQAVFATNYDTNTSPHRGWGWKITPATQLFVSAVSEDDGSNWRNDTVFTDGGPAHPRQDNSFDLAFELTTTNIPSPGVGPQVGFTNISRLHDSVLMWTTGRCGCGKQILETSTNLPPGEPGWVAVATNGLPRPQNRWTNAPPTHHRFFRVRSVN